MGIESLDCCRTKVRMACCGLLCDQTLHAFCRKHSFMQRAIVLYSTLFQKWLGVHKQKVHSSSPNRLTHALMLQVDEATRQSTWQSKFISESDKIDRQNYDKFTVTHVDQ